jgi:hypothetical protein
VVRCIFFIDAEPASMKNIQRTTSPSPVACR